MSGGPSQPKVIGEDWSDERIKSFLDIRCYDETDPDFHILRESYEHMIVEDFKRLVGFFVNSGRNINGLSKDKETILDLVSQHGRSQEYAEILKNAGALKAAEL